MLWIICFTLLLCIRLLLHGLCLFVGCFGRGGGGLRQRWRGVAHGGHTESKVQSIQYRDHLRDKKAETSISAPPWLKSCWRVFGSVAPLASTEMCVHNIGETAESDL